MYKQTKLHSTWLFVLLILVPPLFIADLFLIFAVVFACAYYFAKNMQIKCLNKHSAKLGLAGFTLFFNVLARYAGVAFAEALAQNGSDAIRNHFYYSPRENPYAFSWTLAGLLFTALITFFFTFNYFRQKYELPRKTSAKMALILSIATAPYIFFLPLGGTM